MRGVLLASLAAATLFAAPAHAEGEARKINVPAGDLGDALKVLARQTGDQLVYDTEALAGRKARAVRGVFTAEAALQRLLTSNDILVTRAGPTVLVLKVAGPAPPAPRHPQAAEAGGRPFAVEGAPTRSLGEDTRVQAAAPHVLGEVVVTGSHIRGGSPAAPVLSMDRAALERSGYATISGALQALPQNFGSESTETTAGGVRADPLQTNTGFATGINLRGLGSDSTLVLVNGRRLAGSGNRGDFADLSSLPAIAVERVEILLDGASALYGSDAVGGVVNVILRRDLSGGEIRVRGGAGDGGPHEGVVSTVFGRAWSSGNLLAAYEAYRRDALPSDKRRFTADPDLTRYGGTDYRETFSFPGNVLRTDPATAALAPFWGIPASPAGATLQPADFRAGVINRGNQLAGVDVLPDQRRQSLYLAGRQTLRPGLEVSADARFADRQAKARLPASLSTLTVGRGNPFFVSPNGAATNQIQYSWGGVGPNPVSRSGVQSLSGSVGAALELPGDWRAEGYGAFAQELIENSQSGAVNSLILAEALGNAADYPATRYSASRDGFFNPFAGTADGANRAAAAAILSSDNRSRFRSRVRSANLQADGSLFDLPGGAVKIAVGGQVRREDFRTTGSNFSSTAAPVAARAFQAHREVTSVYGELRAPLIGEALARPGLQRLELSLAVRAEHYSDFGRTVNPRVGLQWEPTDGVRVRATYGESYRAPALTELYSNQFFSSGGVVNNGVITRAINKQGGNPDLGPETAISWTFGVDLQPSFAPDVKLSATVFETRFKDRIDRPLLSAPRGTNILTDPAYRPFVTLTNAATNPADAALLTALLQDPLFSPTLGVFLPSEYGAVFDQRYVNTAGLTVRGIDVQASYRRPAFGGDLSLAANATWMLDYRQAITPAAPFLEFVGLAGQPQRFRSRSTADWSRGPLSLGVAWNHVSGARDLLGQSIRAQDTFDLQGRWRAPDRWGGVTAALIVRNLFDRDPPFYDNPTGFAFDPTNADVVGRFVSVQLSKSW
ncbi:MAG: TonB-dependent receptor [Phenylobacterium zucineum]|nr:MAG: TonB-dependent receptor [Phenylobacterium zucineum]